MPMARATEASQAGKAAVPARKPGRPTVTAARPPAKLTKATAAAKSTRTAAAPAAPRLSTEELRGCVGALERANVTLQARNREANHSARTAAARIAGLEDQVAQLEKRVALAQPKAKR